MRPLFDPFVLPFVISMTFVLLYCLIGMIRIVFQLPKEDRRKFLRSLIYPKSALKNFRDLVNDCLLHTKIWKRKPLLGYMHMSIALGWFMIIIVGHFESVAFSPLRGLEVPFMPKLMSNLYLPIFFRYFAIEDLSLKAQIFSFLMDFFLLMIISGIFIAAVKKKKPRRVGLKRVTKFGIKEDLVRLSLWTIFPLRFLAESSMANIAGGSFLTKYLGFELVFGGNYNETLSMVFWWLYSIDLAIFMTLLPFSRYMHIPAEALLILLRNAGLKTTEPRKGYALAEIYSCPSCGLCIDVCPMSEVKDNYKNTAVYFIRNIRKGKRRRDVKAMTEKCLMCGKCIEVCPLGIESLNIKIAQRNKTYYKIKSDFEYLKSQQALVPEPVEGKNIGTSTSSVTETTKNSTTQQLNNSTTQQLSNSTTQQLYYESGIMIDNLINIGIVKLGLGAFYRYGPYSHESTWDNFVFKVGLEFSL